MQTGDIVIVSFPYTDLISFKARPAVVITETADQYQDVVVSLITSVVPIQLNKHQILIYPSTLNKLKATSVIKVSRIATIEHEKILASIGKLDVPYLDQFREIFQSLVANKS